MVPHYKAIHYNDYICNSVQTSSHWCNLVSSSCLPNSHHYFLSNVTTGPVFYIETSTHAHLIHAMQHELDALAKNNTWTVVPLPQGKRDFSCKWVFLNQIKV